MPRFGFVGNSYKAKSPKADCEETINFMPEVIESGMGRAGARSYLMNTPGLRLREAFSQGLLRAHYTFTNLYPGRDRYFVVAGSNLCEVFYDEAHQRWSHTALGFVDSDGFLAFMTSNGDKLYVASFNKLYTYELATGTFAGPIVNDELELVEAGSVAFLDDYVLAKGPGQQIFYALGGEDWGAADFVEAQASPDAVIRIDAAFNELWAFGPRTIQPFTPTGDFNIPFAPIQSGVINQGLLSGTGLALLDNSWFFLGSDPDRGGPTVWRTTGYSVQKVSNFALEAELATYSRKALNTCVAQSWVLDGHPTFQLSFPERTVNKTWRFDASLPPGMGWYQAAYWNGRGFEAHRALTHAYAFGKHLVGDKAGYL